MFGRQGHAPFYRKASNEIEMVLEPVSFNPGETYLTEGWIYIYPEDYPEVDAIEIKPETQLTFLKMDGEVFCFCDENATQYPIHRGDVIYLKKVD